MPLNDSSAPVEAPQNKDWKPVPEDIYQVVVKDIDEKIMKKFKSEEEDVFYVFKLGILDGGPEANGQTISSFCARKWFSGNKKMNPSKLVTFIKAVYGFYYPKLSVVELEAADMTPKVINDLIGKQLRVSVKFNDDATGNRISDFMAIKKELAIPEGMDVVKLHAKLKAAPAPQEVEAEVSETKETEGKTEKKSDLPF